MKTFIIPAIVAIVCFVSCTEKSKYEQLISDYVQTDKQGVKTDIQLEIIEIKELPPITVKDSTEILKSKFEAEKKERIESANEAIQMCLQGLEKEQKGRIKISTIIDMYKKNMARAQAVIDSVSATQFADIYAGQSQDKVLLQPVQCRYSYIYPTNNPRQEREEILYFTPDITKIVGRENTDKR